jgi:hypothetical protein
MHTTGAPLLPKLRGQFAEFLNGGSLVHLGVLTPAHQCRCAVRVVRAQSHSGFSRRPVHHSTSASSADARDPPQRLRDPDLPGSPSLRANPFYPLNGLLLTTASPPLLVRTSAGLST